MLLLRKHTQSMVENHKKKTVNFLFLSPRILCALRRVVDVVIVGSHFYALRTFRAYTSSNVTFIWFCVPE